ncbi:MAG: hypothetical protein ED556_01215 [Winogradskyella sp.]|nr:MAG: hypothetical protein ED556_01215 [Winogradskyella sp.]
MLLTLKSCQKDDDNNIIATERIVKSRVVSLSEIPNMNAVDLKIEALGLKKTNTILSRTTEVDTSYVETDAIIEMTYSETHTYTFTLISPNPEYYIENVILHYNNETLDYDSYLVQYDVTAEAYVNIHNGGEVPETTEFIISEINGDGFIDLISNRSSCYRVCETINVPCQDPGGAEHQPGDTSCIYHGGSLGAYSYQSCGAVCIDVPEDPNIDAGPSGGGGGSTIDDDDVVTNPNTSEPCENDGSIGITTGDDGCRPVNELSVDEKNCEELSVLGNTLPIKQSFDDLKNKVNDQTVQREFGYKFTEGQNPVELPLFDGDPLHVKPQFGNEIYGMSHTHPSKSYGGQVVYPMFSMDDIYNLGVAAITYNNQPNSDFSKVFFSLTVRGDSGPETFVLKVNNYFSLTAFTNSFGAKQEELNKKLNQRYNDINENNGGNVTQNYLQELFEYLEEEIPLDAFDIYRAVDTNLTSWKKQNYNPLVNIITETDCNN